MNSERMKGMDHMEKNQIYETAFETIKESTEWGIEEENSKIYGHFVDGVVTVVDNLLDKINERTIKNPL